MLFAILGFWFFLFYKSIVEETFYIAVIAAASIFFYNSLTTTKSKNQVAGIACIAVLACVFFGKFEFSF